MKKFVSAILGAILLCAPAMASADPSRDNTAGFQFDIGAPQGVALGPVIRAHFPWWHINGSFTYNAASPGLRIGTTIDPFNYWVSPSLTAEYGGTWSGTLIGVNNSPSISYHYTNAYLGLEFGKRNSARFFLRGGPSYISGTVGNLDQFLTNSNVTASPANFHGTVFPTAELGFKVMF